MIKLLSFKDIGHVSGGWVCAKNRDGKMFRRATWHENHKDVSKNRGVCGYGDDGDENFYLTPQALNGVEMHPIGWRFKRTFGGFNTYECVSEDGDPDQCEFK